MWTYRQTNGELIDPDGKTIAFGYSGRGAGKNNPNMQDVHNVGPIPQGLYIIGIPVDTEKHGPYFLPLTPDPENQMFGRSAFGMHGDNIVNPGTASEGCIIQSKLSRVTVWESGDHLLKVIP